MASQPAASRPDSIRRHNLALMLWHVHRDGALTRAELTQRLGLSRSTVGALVNDLTQFGLLEETVPSGGAGVGRPSYVVRPHPAAPFAVAVDIDIADVTVAAVGLGGTVLSRHVVAAPTRGSSPEWVAGVVERQLARLRTEAPTGAQPTGVGISVPGMVDARTGHVAVAPNLEWHDVALGDLVRRRVPLPVVVGNDADLAVLAEHRRGSARDCDDVVYVLGRIGVGAGIVVGGATLQGWRGFAGEIGHNVLEAAGPPCHCGKRGCVETYVGDGALLALAGRDLAPTDEAMGELFGDARRGDDAALAAVRAAAEPLGRAIAGLVNVLNPQRVLLGGSLGQLLELARDEIESAVGCYSVTGATASVQVVAPRFGADSALLGAAETAFAALLADPLAQAPAAASA